MAERADGRRLQAITAGYPVPVAGATVIGWTKSGFGLRLRARKEPLWAPEDARKFAREDPPRFC